VYENLISLISSSPAVLIGALIGFFIGAVPVFKDTIEHGWKKRFREQVKQGILSGNLKAEDMQHLHERWFQDRQSVLHSLRVMLGDSVSTEDDKLKDKTDVIRGLISIHNEREPFSELPENISLQLNTLRKESPATNDAVTQLAASLNELYSSNKTELSKQKKFSFWGFVVGILGILISISSIYLALTAKT